MPDSARLRAVRRRRFVASASMSSLRQLLAQHGTLLVLDAASARVQVGLLRADASAAWATSEEEAGVGVVVDGVGVDAQGAGAWGEEFLGRFSHRGRLLLALPSRGTLYKSAHLDQFRIGL